MHNNYPSFILNMPETVSLRDALKLHEEKVSEQDSVRVTISSAIHIHSHPPIYIYIYIYIHANQPTYLQTYIHSFIHTYILFVSGYLK